MIVTDAPAEQKVTMETKGRQTKEAQLCWFFFFFTKKKDLVLRSKT